MMHTAKISHHQGKLLGIAARGRTEKSAIVNALAKLLGYYPQIERIERPSKYDGRYWSYPRETVRLVYLEGLEEPIVVSVR